MKKLFFNPNETAVSENGGPGWVSSEEMAVKVNAADIEDSVAAGRAVLTGETAASTVIVKATTGDPASGSNGQICVNTEDENVKIYGGGDWRQIATWAE